MEKKHIDLHTHTRYSDGSSTPEEIVKLSSAKGIDILAISDHDNTRGYFEASKLASQYSITVIPGIEFTTPNYHLLALNFDIKNKAFQEFAEHSREIQNNRCERRVKILEEIGVPITMEKIENILQ